MKKKLWGMNIGRNQARKLLAASMNGAILYPNMIPPRSLGRERLKLKLKLWFDPLRNSDICVLDRSDRIPIGDSSSPS